MCTDGGFLLTKFVRNWIEVLDSIPEEDRRTEGKDVCLNSGTNFPTEKGPGVSLDTESDRPGFNWMVNQQLDVRCYQWSVKFTIHLDWLHHFRWTAKGYYKNCGKVTSSGLMQSQMILLLNRRSGRKNYSWISENGEFFQYKPGWLWENSWWERLNQIQSSNGKIKSSACNIWVNSKALVDSSTFHKGFNYAKKRTDHSPNNQGVLLDR